MTTANPHVAAGVERFGPAPADAAAVVVAVHGRGQAPAYLREHLVAPVGRADIAWLLPAAAGQTWYPLGFLAPLADNQPALDHAIAAIAAIDSELAGLDQRRIVWAGFSQGACLVTEYLARHPRRAGGLLALTGGMIGPEGTVLTVAGSFDGMPAYFGVGDADDWVPLWRVQESADAYRAAGADVTVEVFPGLPHEISPREIDHARALLASVAGR
ncbi:MAG: alpha/beta hydrolase [Acidimicrobiia bacterium]